MRDDVWLTESPVGLIVRPARPAETTVLYLAGDGDPHATPEPVLDLAGHLAVRTASTVVCGRYGASFATALDDVGAAYDHCRASGPTVVAGERLGAGLAAALLLRLRDLGAEPPQCAVLVSALLDLTLEAPSLRLNASADPAFDIARLRRRVERYAAGADPADPLLSPLYGNLHGLPPVKLLAAGPDPLLDDSLAFAARAARSGVTVDLRVLQDRSLLRPETVTAIAGFAAEWSRANGSPVPSR
ncbi:alpha/beta hydrolase fold domain-containing protein [Actinomadura opuntiae]|uniref:alpha/beta hydrolase fold domain-containing protein n=1 Tax=Actinomadura sp. OS1-43 TaxID=604315 RepID=UPI00255B281A|nr:alpha/beta hydrolase [Actinomadura sp. OS1-43]MDL4816375.1 alpha/beta hydrolase [Actinomadura sp. OS1-43]